MKWPGVLDADNGPAIDVMELYSTARMKLRRKYGSKRVNCVFVHYGKAFVQTARCPVNQKSPSTISSSGRSHMIATIYYYGSSIHPLNLTSKLLLLQGLRVVHRHNICLCQKLSQRQPATNYPSFTTLCINV